MKRFLSFILAFALMLSALSMPALAADETNKKPLSEMTFEERIIEEASNAFKTAQINAERESFHGYCGLFVGHLLFALKINKYFQANDGNRWYDYYVGRKTTTGGHHVTTYDSTEYTLEEALLAVCNNGQRTARNILVGFDKTDTDAGQEYGHAVVINAIIDGKVYFVESFDMWIGGRSVPEGEVIKCSISAFATYFDRWAEFEGLVHFGSGSLEEVSPMENTNLWLLSRFEATIRTQPCLIGENRCQLVRNVTAGERLRATGVFKGDRGLFYRVETEDGYGFIPAVSVMVERLNAEDMEIEKLTLPKNMKPGESPSVGGKLSARMGVLSAVEIAVYNETGMRVARSRMVCENNTADLSKLQENLQLNKLQEGSYVIDVIADGDYYVAQGVDIVKQYQTVVLSRQLLVVKSPNTKTNFVPELKALAQEGWVRRDGKWYYYQDGQMKRGWIAIMGTRYYLGADGAAVTGWQTVDNHLRYFGPEGALRRNEQRTYGKSIYWLDDTGVAWFKGEVVTKKKK